MTEPDKPSGLKGRRLCEALAWTIAVAFLWTVDTMSKLAEREQTGFGKDDFRLITDQVTSAVAVLLMILFVVHWLRLFPLKKDALVPAIIGHTAGSIIFAFGHYSLMVVFRILVFKLNGMTYHWVSSYVPNLIVEYQKDIKIYLAIVLIASGYRYYRATHRPAGSALSAGKLVVQTGSGESVVRIEDIDYLEASRNYVSVHAHAREYLVRDTISNLEEKLAGGGFARTHRSFVVNLEKIAELKSVDGAYRVCLRSGAEIPLSRQYRESLKSRLAS